VAVDQKNLNARTSMADTAAVVENDQRENVRKLAQAHVVSNKTFTPLFTRICSSQRSRPGG
jgi:hypothetical protein